MVLKKGKVGGSVIQYKRKSKLFTNPLKFKITFKSIGPNPWNRVTFKILKIVNDQTNNNIWLK